ELVKPLCRRASSLLFWRARARAPAVRALEAGRENRGDPMKDRNSGRSRPASAHQSPHRRVPHRRLEFEYPVMLTRLPSDLEREAAEPSQELQRLPSTILPEGKDFRAAPPVALRCSTRPYLRCASAVPVPLRALLLVGHKMVDQGPNSAPNEHRERRVHRLDVSRRKAVGCLR